MQPARTTSRRLLAGAVLGALTLAACGADDEGAGSGTPPTEAPAFLGRDLGGEAVSAESEIPSNQLPDLVIDNVSTGTKVNFRNIVPSDKPILLWLWAPH